MSTKKILIWTIGVPLGLFSLVVVGNAIRMSNQTPEQQAAEQCYLELPNGDPYGEQKNCETQYLINYNFQHVYKPKYK